MMTKVTISIPNSVKELIRQKIEQNGYGTVSEYIRELIRRDQQAGVAGAAKKDRYERTNGFTWDDTIGDIHEPYPRNWR